MHENHSCLFLLEKEYFFLPLGNQHLLAHQPHFEVLLLHLDVYQILGFPYRMPLAMVRQSMQAGIQVEHETDREHQIQPLQASLSLNLQ